MTKQEAAIITAYTGTLIGTFSEFHRYAEKILGRSVFTHEFGDKHVMEEVKEASKPDFISLHENLDTAYE